MNLADSEICTGCGACLNVCPVNAVNMYADDEGFLQPVIDNAKCIGCSRCTRACPIVSVIETPKQIVKSPVCGCTLSDDVWRASSSGGAFTEICSTLESESPIVFGARFADNHNVVHDLVDGIKQVDCFRKSKYVQSDIGHTFRQCKEFLEKGRFVIFSGTPCQIAGLTGFLGNNEYAKLVTLEFICHGVGSPSFFQACLREVGNQFGRRVSDYTFRFKSGNRLRKDEHTSFYRFADGTTREITRDLYNLFFLNQLCLRKSCMENCRFRRPERYADITLADCRGEKLLYPHGDGKNWSVIIANTEKGAGVIRRLKNRMPLHDYPLELLKEKNPLYFCTTKGNRLRDIVFEKKKRGEAIFAIARELNLICPWWKNILRKLRAVSNKITRKGI